MNFFVGGSQWMKMIPQTVANRLFSYCGIFLCPICIDFVPLGASPCCGSPRKNTSICHAFFPCRILGPSASLICHCVDRMQQHKIVNVWPGQHEPHLFKLYDAFAEKFRQFSAVKEGRMNNWLYDARQWTSLEILDKFDANWNDSSLFGFWNKNLLLHQSRT